jgi:hypothetical protein
VIVVTRHFIIVATQAATAHAPEPEMEPPRTVGGSPEWCSHTDNLELLSFAKAMSEVGISLVNLGSVLFARSRYHIFSIGVHAGQEFMFAVSVDTAAEEATLLVITIDFKNRVSTVADGLLPVVDGLIVLPGVQDKVFPHIGRTIAVPVVALLSKHHFTLHRRTLRLN